MAPSIVTISLSNATFIMGHAASIPQPLLPTLALVLDHDDDWIFEPNNIITGHVSLTPVKPINPFSLEVAFYGRSLIWHRVDVGTNNTSDYNHYRDNAPLFEIKQDILPHEEPVMRNKSGYMIPGQTYTYRFEFSVPDRTSNYRSQHYKHDGSQQWHVNPHTLPPSFLHTSRNGTSTMPNYEKIEYGITARLQCPEVYVVRGKEMLDLTADAPIHFQPLNPYLEDICSKPPLLVRLPKSYTLQSSILTGLSPSNISFRQTLRDCFSSTTPTLDFELIVSIPSLLLIGSEFRIRASFAVLSKTENVAHIPPITFRVLKINLINYTAIRAPRDLNATSTPNGHHRANKHISMPDPDTPYTRRSNQREEFPRDKTLLNALPESITAELEEVPGYEDATRMGQASSCEVWFTARVPGDTKPSFKSFAIARWYGVKVKVGVKAGGKAFEVGGETEVKGLGVRGK